MFFATELQELNNYDDDTILIKEKFTRDLAGRMALTDAKYQVKIENKGAETEEWVRIRLANDFFFSSLYLTPLSEKEYASNVLSLSSTLSPPFHPLTSRHFVTLFKFTA